MSSGCAAGQGDNSGRAAEAQGCAKAVLSNPAWNHFSTRAASLGLPALTDVGIPSAA